MNLEERMNTKSEMTLLDGKPTGIKYILVEVAIEIAKQYAEQMMREVNQTPKIAEFYELTCLDEDGYIGSNGYYTSMESAEKAKKEIDGYKMNTKYGIKQNIITHSFS